MWKDRPEHGVHADAVLQGIVFKMVPGLLRKEIERRKKFRSEHMSEQANNEDEKMIQFSLQYASFNDNQLDDTRSESPSSLQDSDLQKKIYLKCSLKLSIAQIRKFIAIRFSLPSLFELKIHSEQRTELLDFLNLDDVCLLLNHEPNVNSI